MKADMEKCLRCGACMGSCPDHAIRLKGRGPTFLIAMCTGCGTCILVCPVGAIGKGNEVIF